MSPRIFDSWFPRVLVSSFPRVLVVAAFLAATIACGTTASTAPTDLYHGTWNGTLSDRVAGNGTLRLVIPGVGTPGTFTVAFPGGASLSGATAAYQILSGRLNIAFECPPGSGVFNIALDGDHLKGTYASPNCLTLTDGTVDLTK